MESKKIAKNDISALNKYKKICGPQTLEMIYTHAHELAGKHIIFISATYQGGGMAEMLNGLIFLFNEIGIKASWRILHGATDFFVVTKKIHNTLQGEKINLSQRKKRLYNETNRHFSIYTHIDDHNMFVIHDPQPLPLIVKPWRIKKHDFL